MCKQVKQVKPIVEEHIVNEYVFQERPVTIYAITTTPINGQEYRAIGLSKVNWPDRWNRKLGVTIARGRAVDKIAHAIVDGTNMFQQLESVI